MKRDVFKNLENLINCELNPCIYSIENDTDDFFHHNKTQTCNDHLRNTDDKRPAKKRKRNIREKQHGKGEISSSEDGETLDQEMLNGREYEDSDHYGSQTPTLTASEIDSVVNMDETLPSLYLDNIKCYFEKSAKRKGRTKERLRIHREKLEKFSQDFQIPRSNAPYWVYLMSIDPHQNCKKSDNFEHYGSDMQKTKTTTSQKTITHIGKARDPVAKVHMHNERLLSSKSTRAASGLWKMELVIGPFQSKETTGPIREFWKKKKRGSYSRRKLGMWLAATLGLECYDSRINSAITKQPEKKKKEEKFI